MDGLSHWIDRFADRRMDDCGDLTKAKKKLQFAKIQRGMVSLSDTTVDILWFQSISLVHTTILGILANSV